MPKLKAVLESANKKIPDLVNKVNAFAEKCLKASTTLTGDAKAWLKDAPKGVDELYIYMAEKCRMKKIDWKTVEKDKISQHSDVKVEQYLKGLKFMENQVLEFGRQFNEVLNDRTVDNGYDELDTQLEEAAAMIRKRKKKLILLPKYKKKLAGYEAALTGLQKQAEEGRKALADFRQNVPKPPGPARIKAFIGVNADSTLKQLQTACGPDNEAIYKDYASMVLKLNETAKQIKERVWFEGHMKMIRDMIKEAEEMEKE